MTNIRNPDHELPRYSLDQGPEWIDASRRSATSDREILSRLVRSLQSVLTIPKQRIANLGNTDLTTWAALDVEQAVWILEDSYSPAVSGLLTFATSGAGIVPYLSSSPGKTLTHPGILLCSGQVCTNCGFFITPEEVLSKLQFFNEGAGPRIWKDEFGRVYARSLDRVRLNGVIGADNGAGAGRYSYTSDPSSDLFEVSSPDASKFDFPIDRVWFSRSSNPGIYNYNGPWLPARTWTVVS